MKDVVVLIPGIGGSVLTKDGRELWAFSAGAALRGVLSMGRSINRLRLGGDDPEVDDLGDGVKATRLMPDLHVLPGLDWRIDGYGHFGKEVQARFDCVAGKNYFELAYDWRRDNRVAARLLARRSHEWLRAWRESSGHYDAKLVLIGHSMGGIVSRIFLEHLDGWKDTRRLITFGTPYSGSVNALEFLVNGYSPGWGPFEVDLTDTLRSFTSAYQLLPSYRCFKGPDNTWLNLDEVDWSGTDVDAERVVDSVLFHRALRQAVDDRLKTGVPGYEIRPVVGDYQRTKWAAKWSGGKVEAMWLRTVGEEGGDGTVPKVSAVPHEHLDDHTNVMWVSQKHASLQNDTSVINQVGGILRTERGEGGVPVFVTDDDDVALEVDDVTTEEPLLVRARSKSEGAELTAHIAAVSGSGQPTVVPLVPAVDVWSEARVEGLPAQDYRVQVIGGGTHVVTDVASVVDVAAVAAEAEVNSVGY